MFDLSCIEVRGAELTPYLEDLASLRIKVFREWPYLYDGTVGYEAQYLKHYSDCENSIVVLALAGDRVVGASTGMPLEDADDAFSGPFVESEFDPSDIFYFGESVLLPEFRGKGLGHQFFAGRENQARRLGFDVAAFCAVERSQDDSRCPDDYCPLNELWIGKGFVKQETIRARFPWKEIDSEGEVWNELCFWLKRLSD